MFEAIVTLCLATAPDICRDVLMPGFEAETEAQCTQKLGSNRLDIEGLTAREAPRCQPMGLVAEFAEIAPGVFAHRGIISDAAPENYGDLSNVAFVIGRQSVALIDTGGSRKVGEEIYRAIRQHTDLPISDVILTHMHPDHVLGASVFAETGARVVGHKKLATALADRAETYLTNFGDLIGADLFLGTQVVLPQEEVSTETAIDIGGRSLQLRAWQTSHTSNDLTVFDETSGIMFTGDLVFHEHTPALDGSVRGWVAVLDELRDLPVTKIVPGHGGPELDWPQGGDALGRYLDVLIKDTLSALKQGERLSAAAETIGQEEAPNWLLFDLFNPRNATVAFTELEWE